MRLAWFSPIPPSRSGIAAYSSELLPLLRQRHEIDVFVDSRPVPNDQRVFNAHDFVWMHRRHPYDLTVFQMGNASCHDYMWAYLYNYPGLLVLHDAQLHQARALYLTHKTARRDDYLAEFQANHPDAPEDVGYLVVAGMGESLYQHWPMVRLPALASRLTAVHNRRLMQELAQRYPEAAFDFIEMGTADPGTCDVQRATCNVRAACGIPESAIVVAAYGGVTPEKRIPALIRALSAIKARRPNVHLLLVGATADHYDAIDDAKRWRVEDRVHITGFVADEDLPAYLAAADICACLRWPTNRETSASWLRCLAAGKPTLITELTQLVDTPTINPHDWQPRKGVSGDPIAVSIDIVDEDHSLHLALDRLAGDAGRRERLGRAAREWWEAHHQLTHMAADYERVMARAVTLPALEPQMPAHLGAAAAQLRSADGSADVMTIADRFAARDRLSDLFNPTR